MGSGKSTIGKALAKLLKRPFADLDHEIEGFFGKRISTIFETEGETAFREKEKQRLGVLLDKNEPHVIALGGGTVCFHNNLEEIKKHGVLVFLDTSPEILFNRIAKRQTQRPLLKNLSGEALLKFIRDTLEQREPFYSQAHIRISNPDAKAETLYQYILDIKK